MSDKPPALPVVTPAGNMLVHMSARRRTQVMDTVFEMIGGAERLAHEATKDSDGFWNFAKMWGKGQARMSSTEHSVNTKSVEDLWAKLDERKRTGHDSNIIDGEVEDVPD